MASLAVRNLFHDRVRLAVTLTGIVFAVVLVAIQIGLFIGFTTTTSNLIDHSGADLWIMSKGVAYIEVGVPFSDKQLHHALAVPGVADARRYIVRFSQWKRQDGAQQSCEIVGFDPDSPLGGPWDVVDGNVRDLKLPDTVIVDRFYAQKLGVARVGDTVEIRNVRARVVGFSQGIRTFTTSPLIFTSLKNAQHYTGLPGNQQVFLLVKTAAGSERDRVRQELLARLRDVDVFTTAEFSAKTTHYWMFGTGAGVTVIIAAVLGLLVGVVVVAQTIYAATIDHIREYGTLKAMGATNRYIYRIILEQAAISAVIGYGVGIVVASAAAFSSRNGGANIVLTGAVGAGLFGLTLMMCVSAAMVSINKVTKIDPAMVFKG
ncbi:ABC efflux pump, inner membrane subunit [Candidatus Sulfopaludibacter sp. SbA6]|nr:ABC efflux pump, inner membrane subunit [Candidatus Sulfopaludibacter sp. SbA6]